MVLVPSGLAREILTGLGAKVEMNLQAPQSLNFTVNNFSIQLDVLLCPGVLVLLYKVLNCTPSTIRWGSTQFGHQGYK